MQYSDRKLIPSKSRRSAKVRICRVCKNSFRPFHPNDLRRGKYCSRECWKKATRKFLELKCKQCGRLFVRRLAHWRHKHFRRGDKRFFCSRRCFVLNNRTEDNPLRRQAGELKYHHGTKKWKELSAQTLAKEPRCAVCGRKA